MVVTVRSSNHDPRPIALCFGLETVGTGLPSLCQGRNPTSARSWPTVLDCGQTALQIWDQKNHCLTEKLQLNAHLLCSTNSLGKNTFFKNQAILCAKLPPSVCPVTEALPCIFLYNGERELTSTSDKLFHSTAAPGHHCWCRSVPPSLLVIAPACMYSFLSSMGWKDYN